MEKVKRKKKGRPKTVFKKLGRKPKLTIEIINEIETLIGEGYTNQDICAVLDINESTFYAWINRAEEIANDEQQLAISENNIFLELTKTIKRATAKRKNDLKTKIERHGNKQWQALAWILERSYPQEFAKQEIEQGEKQTIQVELIKTSKKNLDKIRQVEEEIDEHTS